MKKILLWSKWIDIDYAEKLKGVIEEGVKKGTYKRTRFEKSLRYFVQKALYIRTL